MTLCIYYYYGYRKPDLNFLRMHIVKDIDMYLPKEYFFIIIIIKTGSRDSNRYLPRNIIVITKSDLKLMLYRT